MPRELEDLPYAPYLEPLTGGLEREGDYDGVHLRDATLDDVNTVGARFMESAVQQVTINDGRMDRSRYNDVWFHTVRWIGVNLAETDWFDVEVISSAMSGVPMFGSKVHQVVFHNCKLDSVNLRSATLRNVTFDDCLLREVDFAGATLKEVSFPGSELEEVRFDKAQLAKVDFRGARTLGIADGLESLRGATISMSQLFDLAPRMAQSLGISVRD
ncbi:pentapeptide repeat-containing protein [Herbidospora sp. NBRC 101105]|uniref:pentapeptide repeat-containing protein n=1 Tax=Herbidospora sp. NBRC 101105 TaxID=3032195 RepID=UPI0024A5F959|nr:pentapeptide repeat-containing protein [Herbidospora sp. NBRC 101105]GLX94994.1 hypothetical protein Hesp01_29440 [Herbidospora sp. NBRC 101105]